MDFVDQKISDYCGQFSEPESDLLRALNRDTHVRVSSPRMLSGHLQGRFLAFLSHLVKPRLALEIGTYTGYSALCLAEGLDDDGLLITIDPNEETSHFAEKYISQSPLGRKIRLVCGDAAKEIPNINSKLDLVFIDADKRNYGLYFDLVIDKMREGGLIVADNVLWSGKVIADQKDADTAAIHSFNKKVASDRRVAAVMLPVRDGLTLLRKL
jgi:caffeoyl-CoA O-methyltransferase